MKPNIKQLTDAHISNIEGYIIGNIAVHLIEDARNMENGYHFYLTEEEIDDYEQNWWRRNEIVEEVEAWITQTYNHMKL